MKQPDIVEKFKNLEKCEESVRKNLKYIEQKLNNNLYYDTHSIETKLLTLISQFNAIEDISEVKEKDMLAELEQGLDLLQDDHLLDELIQENLNNEVVNVL